MAKWKRDALYSLILLVICAVNYVIVGNMDDAHVQYALGSPNGYLKMWLIVLALLAVILLIRSLRKRPQEESPQIWNRLSILTVTGSVLYILTVRHLGFFLTTFILVSVLTIAYGSEALGRKRGKEMLVQDGKFLLFALLLTLATQEVFRELLSVKLPSFSLF